jgi:hypothetical protein
VETPREKGRQVGMALVGATLIGGIFATPSIAAKPEDKIGSGKGRPTTFEGSCSLKGTVIFEPGATVVRQPLTYDFTGEGTCSGKLNGRDITDEAVASHQFGDAEGSCLQAETTRPGTGELTFSNGELLTYSLEFVYTFPETDFTWQGSRSGRARGTGTFRTDRTPPDTTARCATPDGAAEVPMDVTIETETLMVSSAKR